jgi:predicted transcriptional regulator
LENLATALERPYTWVLEKAVEAALPALEEKYKKELSELRTEKKTGT